MKNMTTDYAPEVLYSELKKQRESKHSGVLREDILLKTLLELAEKSKTIDSENVLSQYNSIITDKNKIKTDEITNQYTIGRHLSYVGNNPDFIWQENSGFHKTYKIKKDAISALLDYKEASCKSKSDALNRVFGGSTTADQFLDDMYNIEKKIFDYKKSKKRIQTYTEIISPDELKEKLNTTKTMIIAGLEILSADDGLASFVTKKEKEGNLKHQENPSCTNAIYILNGRKVPAIRELIEYREHTKK